MEGSDKMKKSSILTLATLALTVVGSILASKQQEMEINEAVEMKMLEMKEDKPEESQN